VPAHAELLATLADQLRQGVAARFAGALAGVRFTAPPVLAELIAPDWLA
jgi:hypothetical protein